LTFSVLLWPGGKYKKEDEFLEAIEVTNVYSGILYLLSPNVA